MNKNTISVSQQVHVQDNASASTTGVVVAENSNDRKEGWWCKVPVVGWLLGLFSK